MSFEIVIPGGKIKEYGTDWEPLRFRTRRLHLRIEIALKRYCWVTERSSLVYIRHVSDIQAAQKMVRQRSWFLRILIPSPLRLRYATFKLLADYTAIVRLSKVFFAIGLLFLAHIFLESLFLFSGLLTGSSHLLTKLSIFLRLSPNIQYPSEVSVLDAFHRYCENTKTRVRELFWSPMLFGLEAPVEWTQVLL